MAVTLRPVTMALPRKCHGRLPRRRTQRAFCRWLREKNGSLPFSLGVVRRTDSTIVCHIKGITNAIRVTLGSDLCVSVDKDGEVWDILLWLDCQPQKLGNHYVFAFCPPHDQERFDNREEWWQSHLFAPLARWMQTLQSANWLLLFETCPGRSTWARLEAGSESGHYRHLAARLPVHETGRVGGNPAA